jgi:hypothetical protein
VERSDTHHLTPRGYSMGIAALHPSYENFADRLTITTLKSARLRRTHAGSIAG